MRTDEFASGTKPELGRRANVPMVQCIVAQATLNPPLMDHVQGHAMLETSLVEEGGRLLNWARSIGRYSGTQRRKS